MSISPQEIQPQQYYFLSPQRQQPQQDFSYHHFPHLNHFQPFDSATTAVAMAATAVNHPRSQNEDSSVAQALEIARDSPDGSSDPTISKILEAALSRIWDKVQRNPDTYVMTRDEFAVFNFFQYRFTGNKMAVSARKRYWDNTHA
ncbi:hypothetical protein IL306_002486 [Fusarium sp. DS 682]|nr:hypothetical protein IL306_002486 [Fusarium sp. DS 682]